MLDKNSRALIVGGTGFIGQHLSARLQKQDVSITLLGKSVANENLYPGVECIKADLLSVSDLARLRSRSFDYVFNLSGYIDHSNYFSGGREVINNHYVGLLNLLEALDISALKGFVQVGSSDEYGNNPSPQLENMREDPISPYACAKLSASNLIQMLANTENFPGCVLRFFLVYGPGQNEKRFLPQVIRGCLENKSFPTSKGKQIRDFCYVDDVVEAMILAATNAQVHGEIFNIASSVAITIREVIEKINKKIGKGFPEYGCFPYRKGENMALYANISKAKAMLSWAPKTSLDQGLSKTIEYYKKTYYCLKKFNALAEG